MELGSLYNFAQLGECQIFSLSQKSLHPTAPTLLPLINSLKAHMPQHPSLRLGVIMQDLIYTLIIFLKPDVLYIIFTKIDLCVRFYSLRVWIYVNISDAFIGFFSIFFPFIYLFILCILPSLFPFLISLFLS